MSLIEQNKKVCLSNSLTKFYDTPIFIVDLIKDAYSTTDPFLISKLLKELFEIDYLTIEEITFILHNNIVSSQKYTINIKDIF